LALISCVPAANFFIHEVGTFNGESTPRTFTLLTVTAPSGVVFAGLSFVLRDLLQIYGGRFWAYVAIAIGSALSVMVSPSLALASALAFALSEIVDMVIFTRMLPTGLGWAGISSNVIASAIDTIVFLGIAFGASSVTQFGGGQFLAKVAASLTLGLPIVALLRRLPIAASEVRKATPQ
jgi:uncharacterized PurR-regulated membrane protein YhhQ (DUF165 family)